MRADSKALTTFFRAQGIYLCLALVGCGIFWAISQRINPFTVILYSLCIGNFLSPPMQWLHVLYEKPAPYDWIIFLILLCVVTLPVYGLSTVIVWWLAPPTPQSLGHLITTGWKMPFLITIVYGVMNFLYGRTRARLERRNFELQGMVQAGAARLEIQDEELQRAREIQESLLPKEIPQLPGFEVARAWQPARAVGGDHFDVLKLGENRLAICIADVSGKGVPAALLMANVQASLRASVRDMDSPARGVQHHQRYALPKHRGRSIRNLFLRRSGRRLAQLSLLQCRPSVSHSGFLRRRAHARTGWRGARRFPLVEI
jgi:sigma-B regulation protein RsbU (phosphoserine phosphatase)